MSAWNINRETASIVLVGNFNPSIFHPEWFIRKGIAEEWDYGTDDNIINLPDTSQFTLPGGKKVTVLLNKFVITSSLASDHLALKDIATSAFAILRETPIAQMGMNYEAEIQISNREDWLQFGRELAPLHHWVEAANYISDLDKEQQETAGLWEMVMNLPRPDELTGFVRPKIQATSLDKFILSFSVNNHVEITDHSAELMAKILDKNWESSLELSRSIMGGIMESHLRDQT